MSALGFILMALAGLGAVVGMRLVKQGKEQGLLLAVPSALLAVGLAVLGLARSGDDTPRLARSLNRYGYASGEVLGRYLAEHHGGARLLLLVQPTFAGQTPDMMQVAIEEGLRAGVGEALVWAGTVPLDPPPAYVENARQVMMSQAPPEDGWPECPIPFEMRDYRAWFGSGYLAGLLKGHEGGYDVLVSAAGLPDDFPRSPLARGTGLPETVAVLNAHGVPMRQLMGSGVIDVLVASKPSANPWQDAQDAPEDTEEAFAKRFLLVTRANFEELAQAVPGSPHWN